MIKVTLIIKQLNIEQTQSILGNQKIDAIIRNLLYKAEIDLSVWNKFQFKINHNNTIYGCEKTFDELKVQNLSKLFIILSQPIIIEIMNKQFPFLQFKADAFDRVQKFQEWIIKNHLRNHPYDIKLINKTDGRLIEKETWIQNTILDQISVLLYINARQNIKWQDNQFVQEINIFSPISKLIQNIRNQYKINNMILLQYKNTILEPEQLYFDCNIPPNEQIIVTIPNQFIYRISFEKMKKEKQITCDSNQQINNLIKQLRIDFGIDKTSKIFLQYQWTLDGRNTIAQEDIPNYSLINLVEEVSDGDFQIILQNIGENANVNQRNQIEIVNKETTLFELSKKIQHENNETVIYFLDQQSEKLDDKLKMDNLNIYQGATIMYKIIKKKPQIFQIEQQLELKQFGILIVNMNTVINIDFYIQQQISVLAGVLIQKLGIPKNQVLKFSIGTQLLDFEDYVNKIQDGNFQFLQVYLLETIDIYIQNLPNNSNSKKLITVRLEDKLRDVAKQLNIQGSFKKNGQYLGLDETFVQLQVFNKETIFYDKTTPNPDEEVCVPIPFTNSSVIVNAKIGGAIYKFKLNCNITFKNLKKQIYQLVIQGRLEQLHLYSLYYEDQELNDDHLVTSLEKNEIYVQLKLKQNIF
ncbi:unnamed protein product [Paramecium sonneborni]|uniref:Ubiquitin-like domain-containing protein n=1 Tax=Paramecium sonneborni TaxID=65129 RepID=A0A8S1RCS0_9CILI|nr:unnamed protein product [Paramecium sonneborni]